MKAAKLRLAQAAMGRPETRAGARRREPGATRQTLRRHAGPKGKRSGAGCPPAGEAEAGRHREEDFAPKLRHTCATNPLNAGSELVDIKALLGRERIATVRIDADVGQERMEKVAGRL